MKKKFVKKIMNNKLCLKFISDESIIEYLNTYKSKELDDNFYDLMSCIRDYDLFFDTMFSFREKYKRFSCFYAISHKHEEDFIWYILKRRKELFFLPVHIIALVKSNIISDEYKKALIENWSDYDLNFVDIKDLMISLKDSKYILNYMKENDLKKLQSTSGEYIVDYILADLRLTIFKNLQKDVDKMEVIKNKEEYHLKTSDALAIFSTINRGYYRKKIINNYHEYNILDSELGLYIARMKSQVLKKMYINDDNLDDSNKLVIALSLNNDKVKKYYLDNICDQDIELDTKLDIPDDLTFGIEIESEGESSSDLKNMVDYNGWVIHNDGSLRNGVEFSSPILNSKTGEKEIGNVCLLLNLLKQNINDRCGGHIHFGYSYFEDNLDAYKVFVELFCNIENILFIVCNGENISPRKTVEFHAKPFSLHMEHALENDEVTEYELNNQNAFTKLLKEVQSRNGRCTSINFNNIGRYNKNTIEFRMPNGSINANDWIKNVNLFASLFKVAKEISVIEKKDINKISDKEKEKLELFLRIRNNTLNDEQILYTLLDLLFDNENQKEIYRRRYIINRKYDINESITNHTCHEKIALSNIQRIRTKY